jgi:tRNA (cytidine56-2'-O)-methyltransferase
MQKTVVLRLGHRIERDKRISTHVALVTRAMGCSKIIYSGQHDKSLEDSVNKVVKQWGGKFGIEYVKNWKRFLKNWKGKIVHLTIYGLPFQKEISKTRKFKKPLLIVVGGEKVPSEVYQLSDFNLSVTQQPHSEVSSLCLFLDYYFKGRELNKKFKNAKLKIIPQKKGKRVLRKDNNGNIPVL